VADLDSRVSSLEATVVLFRNDINDIKKDMVVVKHALVGDIEKDKKGLITKVDNNKKFIEECRARKIEDSKEKKDLGKWIFRTISGGILGLIFAKLQGWF